MDDGPLCPGKFYPSALAAGVKAFAGEHNTGLSQFLIVLSHFSEQLLTWQDAAGESPSPFR